MSAAWLTVEHRAAMARLADVIAPATARMPSAGALGLAAEGGLIDRALQLRPDLAPTLQWVLEALAGEFDPPAVLRRLQVENPATLLALLQVVAGAYYLHPEVKARIGYAGQEAQSLDRGRIGGEDSLAAMMERPPRWRRAGSLESAPA